LFFNPNPVTNFDEATQSDTDRFAQYFWGMLNRGQYLPCSQFEANFVSVPLSDAELKATLQAADETFAEIAQG